MLILITYDIQTDNDEGRRRLRQVAKLCENYGQRVQFSVFECDLSYSQYLIFRRDLLKIIDENKDSIRICRLGTNFKDKIEHYGKKESYDTEGFIFV